jgi:hypothetical protein
MLKYVLGGAMLVGALVGLGGAGHAAEPAAPVAGTHVEASPGVFLFGPYPTFAEAAVVAQRLENLGYHATVIVSADHLYYVYAE